MSSSVSKCSAGSHGLVCVFAIGAASLKSPRQFKRPSYVSTLAVLVASGQKDDQALTLLHEVHPVAGSVVDANLGNPFAHRPHISRIAQ